MDRVAHVSAALALALAFTLIAGSLQSTSPAAPEVLTETSGNIG